jgi:hypothetical protein
MIGGIAIMLFFLQIYRLHGMQIVPNIVPEPGAERAREMNEHLMVLFYFASGFLAALQLPWSCFLAWRLRDWRLFWKGVWRSAILVFGWALLLPAAF